MESQNGRAPGRLADNDDAMGGEQFSPGIVTIARIRDENFVNGTRDVRLLDGLIDLLKQGGAIDVG